jgi:hypothetical protein
MELLIGGITMGAGLVIGFWTGVRREREQQRGWRQAVREHERRLFEEQIRRQVDMSPPWESQPAWARAAWSAAGITQELFDEVSHTDGAVLPVSWRFAKLADPRSSTPSSTAWSDWPPDPPYSMPSH